MQLYLDWKTHGQKTAPSEASMPLMLSPQAITSGGRFSLTLIYFWVQGLLIQIFNELVIGPQLFYGGPNLVAGSIFEYFTQNI